MLAFRAAALALLAALAACAAPPPQGRTPFAAKPEMAELLTIYRNLRPLPIESLTPAQARREPVMADAVRGWWNVRGLPTKTDDVPQVADLTIEATTAHLPARLYGPAKADRPVPVILYFHGGGWVIGGLDAYDASARALALRTGAMVLSVHYRQAPEYKFPAAHDDALAAYRWLLASAANLGGDPRRIALAGESAGGNLALATAIAARDAGLPPPAHLLLVYPVASTNTGTASMSENSGAFPLSRWAVQWYAQQYANGPADLADPRLDLVRADLSRLPPTTIVLAQIDPLRSGGEELAARMQAAGTPVDLRTYEGMTHEFFSTGSVVPDARAAEDYASQRLSRSFAAIPASVAASAPVEAPRPVHRRARRARPHRPR